MTDDRPQRTPAGAGPVTALAERPAAPGTPGRPAAAREGGPQRAARARNRRTSLLLLAPSLVLLLAVFAFAVETLVEYSFQKYEPGGTNITGTAASWAKVLGGSYYWSVIWQTVQVGLLVTVVTAVVGYLTALALHHIKRTAWRNAGYAVVFSSLIFSGIASVYAWQLLLGQEGFLNSALGLVGVGPVHLLYEKPAVVIALVHTLLPLVVLPISSSLRQIDGTLAEVADDFGASRWRTFRTITLPLSAPGLIAGCQLTFALTISSFTAPSMLGGGRVATLSTTVYSLVGTTDFPAASVCALVLLVLAIVSTGIFVLVQRRFAEADQGGVTVSPSEPKGIRGLGVWMALVYAFQLVPAAIVVISSLSSVSYGVWPPPGFSTRWYTNLFEQEGVTDALVGSLWIGALVAVLAVVLGSAGAVALVRYRFRGSGSIQSALFSPVVVPKIAFGFAVFMLLARLGMTSGRWAVVLAHTVATVPFVIVLLSAALSRADRTLDYAAVDLGARPLTAFVRATLPQIAPAMLVSGVFAFLISFNEVDLSIFLLNSDQQTLPVWMFTYLNNYQDPTPAALSTLMTLMSVVVVGLGALALRLTQRGRRLTI
ncbi:ABC transporter permease [Streptomyces sp. NBC_01477]|uniref:ABC transporter permease n=1 Tax=Streptomyces sp. NBC_01477 TaxID=2976015 RepID=UPI002E35B8BE|nr:ABC transporter permease subunit [Streptomyces sp. NBC_01477]